MPLDDGRVPFGIYSHKITANETTQLNRTILVLRYAFNQKRIQITDTSKPDPHAPPGHGSIIHAL